jgi:site-specific recombinase XerD
MPAELTPFAHYLAGQGLSLRTVQGYEADVGQYLEWIQTAAKAESDENAQLTPDTLRAYLQFLGAKCRSAGTLNRLIAALRAYERFLGTEPALAGMPRLAHQPEAIPEANRKELRALIKEFHRQRSASRTERQTWHAVRNWAILQVLRETGLRAGKVCALRVESSAEPYEASILSEIFPGVELSTTARQALMDWLGLRKPGPGLLFTSYGGLPLQPCDLYRLMRALGSRANVHVTPEMLR